MTFHLLLPRRFDLDAARDLAQAGKAPRHAMAELAAALDAKVHEPNESAGRPAGRLRSFLAPSEPLWSLARDVLGSTGPSDAVFCSSEAGGLQLAALAGKRRPRIAMFVHNLNRPRAWLALKAWRIADKVDLFMACSPAQVSFLKRFLNLTDARVKHVWDHTDTRFFTPGAPSVDKKRAKVVSVGLEQRDYKTLAGATSDLDLDVRISGFSKDAAAMARTFPGTLPPNMDRRFYSWPDLAQLYRDADVVVVSVHENRYAAGVQSLMEASAAGRPVVVTSTEGLQAYIDDSVLSVSPGDSAQMRAKILEVLADPASASERAARGRSTALVRYDMDRYVACIAEAVRSMS